MIDIVRTVGSHFTHEQYILLSKIQGTLWSLADVVIVFYLIRIANVFRVALDLRRHVGSYVALALTLPFVAWIPFIQDAQMFYRLEVAVTVPHFLLILYICTADARHAVRAVGRRLSE